MQQQELVAGTTLNFLTVVPDYPATAGWTLKYYLRLRTGAGAIDLTAAAEGADYRVQVPASGAGSTVLWTAGVYGWESRVEKGTEKYPVDSGQITIRPDISGMAGTYDSRSQARKALDDARAALAAWTPTTRRYRIGTRELEFSSKADIVGAIEFWTAEVKREEREDAMRRGAPDPRRAYMRLNRE